MREQNLTEKPNVPNREQSRTSIKIYSFENSSLQLLQNNESHFSYQQLHNSYTTVTLFNEKLVSSKQTKKSCAFVSIVILDTSSKFHILRKL